MNKEFESLRCGDEITDKDGRKGKVTSRTFKYAYIRLLYDKGENIEYVEPSSEGFNEEEYNKIFFLKRFRNKSFF